MLMHLGMDIFAIKDAKEQARLELLREMEEKAAAEEEEKQTNSGANDDLLESRQQTQYTETGHSAPSNPPSAATNRQISNITNRDGTRVTLEKSDAEADEAPNRAGTAESVLIYVTRLYVECFIFIIESLLDLERI